MSDNRNKCAFLYRQVNALERIDRRGVFFGFFILIIYIFHFYKSAHKRFSLPLYRQFCQIAVLPQGSVRPLSITCRPISELEVLPPKRFCSIVPNRYSMTDGDNPVV